MTAADHHPIVASHKAVKAVEKQRRELDEARRKFLAERSAAAERERQAQSQWLEVARAAILRGEQPPPQPVPERNETGVNPEHAFLGERQRLDRAETDALREHAEELGARLTDRAEQLTSEAVELVSRLDVLAAEATLLRRSGTAVRRACGDQTTAPVNLDALGLARAMQAEVSLLGNP